MERPTVTIEGMTYKIKSLTGGDWRVFGEFTSNASNYTDSDFIEKHAEFISKFITVTPEEILEKMPLAEILPASRAIQNYIVNQLTARLVEIEKNSAADKAQ